MRSTNPLDFKGGTIRWKRELSSLRIGSFAIRRFNCLYIFREMPAGIGESYSIFGIADSVADSKSMTSGSTVQIIRS